MSKKVPGAEDDWTAVGEAVRSRMLELKMSKAELARQTGLSETTIRYIGQPGARHNISALVAISAALRWRHDYLTNILHGEPHKNVLIKPPPWQALRAEVAELRKTVHEMDKKLDALLNSGA